MEGYQLFSSVQSSGALSIRHTTQTFYISAWSVLAQLRNGIISSRWFRCLVALYTYFAFSSGTYLTVGTAIYFEETVEELNNLICFRHLDKLVLLGRLNFAPVQSKSLEDALPHCLAECRSFSVYFGNCWRE